MQKCFLHDHKSPNPNSSYEIFPLYVTEPNLSPLTGSKANLLTPGYGEVKCNI